MTEPKHLVLFDGECDFCRRSVTWLQKHDRFDHLRFEPYQSAALSPALGAACQKAIHVQKNDGEWLRAGRATLFCGQQTRWHQLARIGQWPIFLPFVELGYALVATHRPFFSRLLFRN